MAELEKVTGRCLCGAVDFTAKNVEPHFDVCHCSMCRRWSGGVMMAVEAKGGVDFSGEENIALFRASDWGERGFCKICGTNLFWRMQDGSYVGVAYGALDNAGDFDFTTEIFIDHKPDAYAFEGDRKQMTEADVLAAFAAPPAEGSEQ